MQEGAYARGADNEGSNVREGENTERRKGGGGGGEVFEGGIGLRNDEELLVYEGREKGKSYLGRNEEDCIGVLVA
jgi:hypothetical protein